MKSSKNLPHNIQETGKEDVKSYLLVDFSNLFHRAMHVVRGDTPDEKVGMTLHIMFSCLYKAHKRWNDAHIVFCLDGHSWRYNIYPPYKANRIKSGKTIADMENEKIFNSAYDAFKHYVTTRTNATILQSDVLEADDLISGFIQSHPENNNIIVSGDMDFQQLLSPYVTLYDGVNDKTTTVDGIFDTFGKKLTNRKTGLPIEKVDPEWSLFEKCVRGCPTDNIFSAYPGVRSKGSKNKVGLKEAFEDRLNKGFSWNALMQHTWNGRSGEIHTVKDDYERNCVLVNLKMQPEHIQEEIFHTIQEACFPRNTPQIGFSFLKFCGKYDLEKISNNAKNMVEMLSIAYR